MERILETQTSEQMAEIIFHDFELHRSTCIIGFEVVGRGRLESKGDRVIDELVRLDTKFNTTVSNGKRRRKRVIPANTVGGYVAHKQFKFHKVMTDEGPKVTIWRVQ